MKRALLDLEKKKLAKIKEVANSNFLTMLEYSAIFSLT
jgi:hypothetical protein